MAPRPSNPALAVDILRVTADLIEEKGPDAITMREVAEKLGISATTIYLYYKDKDELLDAAIDRAFEWFADAQEQAETDACCGIDVLRARGRGYVEWGLEHPNLYRAMFERPQHYSEERSRIRRRSYFAYGEAVKRLMESGELQRTDHLDQLVNLTWAANHGIVSLVISGRMFGAIGDRISREDAKARALAMVDASMEQWLRAWEAQGV